jgi:hypothetical protein
MIDVMTIAFTIIELIHASERAKVRYQGRKVKRNRGPCGQGTRRGLWK